MIDDARAGAIRPPPSPAVGRMLIVGAALLWSTSGLFVKAPLFVDWPVAERGALLAFWRATFAAVVLIPFVRRPRWRIGLIPLCIAFTAMNVLYLSAMSMTTAANAIWLQSTAPFWVFLIGAIGFRQPVPRGDLLPLAFACGGVGLILAFESQGESVAGVSLGLASGLAYGLVVLLLHQLADEDSAWLIALCHAVAAAFLLPWVFARGVWPSAGQLGVLAGFGTVQMAVPYLLLTVGLRSVRGQEAVLIGLLEPIVLPLWVWMAWHERPDRWTVAGAGLILVGLVLRYGRDLLRRDRANEV
ncbi:MAG: DMT family transporter [Planctomycetota bacterium]